MPPSNPHPAPNSTNLVFPTIYGQGGPLREASCKQVPGTSDEPKLIT